MSCGRILLLYSIYSFVRIVINIVTKQKFAVVDFGFPLCLIKCLQNKDEMKMIERVAGLRNRSIHLKVL